MENLVRMFFALVLLLFALSIALSYLSGPMSFLKKTGAMKASRAFMRGSWRLLVFGFQLLTRSRQHGIRRPGAGHKVRRPG